MCPKADIPVCERSDSVPQDKCQQHNMTPALRSIFLEDKQESGLSSVNLPGMDEAGMYSICSIEHALSHMKINSGLQSSHQDSGTHTSHCSPGAHENEDLVSDCMLSGDVSIDAVCGRKCCDEDIALGNVSDCDDILRKRGCDILTRAISRLFEGDKDGDNSLHLSIINGRTAYSRLLINLAPEYNCLSFSNNLRQTPLHLAVLTRQPDIVRRLVCAGAAVLAQDVQGNTPLHIACALGDELTVRHLLAPVLYEETLENKYSIPYQRVPQDLSIRNYEGHTCLHIAVSTRNFEVVQILLDTGVNINVGDSKSGRSVLHFAADTGDTEMVGLLLSSRGINVHTQDYAGFTPAQLAYGRNHQEIVKMIFTLSGQYGGVHISEITLDED
ncbi:hypothetical protein BsWGS_06338 [Bradybaena similaris]